MSSFMVNFPRFPVSFIIDIVVVKKIDVLLFVIGLLPRVTAMAALPLLMASLGKTLFMFIFFVS
jgi:hypothetical protein